MRDASHQSGKRGSFRKKKCGRDYFSFSFFVACNICRFISGSSLNWRYEGSLQIDAVCAQSRDIKTGINLFLSKLTGIDILKV